MARTDAPEAPTMLETFQPALTDLALLAQAAHQSWRIVAHNPAFTGETEGFGFTNGAAVVTALPARVTCERDMETCEKRGDLESCALHKRMRHLAALGNYPAYELVRNERTNRSALQRVSGYLVLSEAEYDDQFGDLGDGPSAGGFEIPDI